MTRLDALLAGLARERSTGALRLGRNGTIFLHDGRVTYMECAQTPGVERLLTARGRMTEAALRGLQADGGCARLLEEGVLTPGELQFAVLGAVLDAAFFLLPISGTRPKFRPGELHWLGGQWFFDVAGLVRECARRRAHLADIWPSAEVDTLPVRPVPWLPGHGVTLTRVQWEVIVRADHKATPLELAKQLGRSGYAVLLAVRRLAATGLLAPGDPDRTAVPAPGRSRHAEDAESDEAADGGEAPGAGLPKRARHPYERPPHDPGAVAQPLGPPVTGDPTDLALLMRLKKALEELA
ncbi:ADAM 12 protein [Nonomuraea jabiensis]|uniref:Uncharacterized protein n=1 Tax=Nonomuraea jabiensis TaxID=882448 RepID=A0A7W9G8I7_9ACTN|nr:ADAM 12 protein [Nonomuraea jabiensis]MBB5779146.1 hypothetical protein [Nonomuraea jabiensis]